MNNVTINDITEIYHRIDGFLQESRMPYKEDKNANSKL
jgi:hypothetical protein